MPSVNRALTITQVTSLIEDNTIERPYGVVPQHSAPRKQKASTNHTSARAEVVESTNQSIRRIYFDPKDEVAASLYRAVYNKLMSLNHSQLDENTLRTSFDERELQRLARIDPFDNAVSNQDLPTIVLEDFCNGLLGDPDDIFHSASNVVPSPVAVQYEEIDLTGDPSETASDYIPKPPRRPGRPRHGSSKNNESQSSHSFSVYQYQPEKHSSGRRFTATEIWQQKLDWYTAVYDVLCTLSPSVTSAKMDAALTHDSLAAIASLHGYVVHKARKAQLVSLVRGLIADGALTDPDQLPLEPLGVRDDRDRSPEPALPAKRQKTRSR